MTDLAMTSRTTSLRPASLGRAFRHPAAGVVVAWFLVLAYMWFTQPAFWTYNNFTTVLTGTSVLAILSMGVLFVMIGGGIDLSVGSLLGLTGVIIWQLADHGVPVWLAALLGIVFSTAVGAFITGPLVALGSLSAFVVTLAGLTAFSGLAGVLSDGGKTNMIDASGIVAWLGSGTIGSVPVAPLVMLVAFGLTFWVLRTTWFGRELYAVGGNPEAARLAGVNVTGVRILSFAVAGLYVGVAAVVQIGRFQGAVPPTAGSGMELTAIAALLLGGVALAGGTGGAVGALIGVLFLATLENALDILGVSTYWKDVVTGVILVGALLLTPLRTRIIRISRHLSPTT